MTVGCDGTGEVVVVYRGINQYLILNLNKPQVHNSTSKIGEEPVESTPVIMNSELSLQE